MLWSTMTHGLVWPVGERSSIRIILCPFQMLKLNNSTRVRRPEPYTSTQFSELSMENMASILSTPSDSNLLFSSSSFFSSSPPPSLFFLEESQNKGKQREKIKKEANKEEEDMSIAPSFPSIKIKISPPPPPPPPHPHPFKLSFKPSTVIRSSKAEGPLRRPATPLSPSPPPLPLSPPPPLPSFSPTKPATPSESPRKPVEAAVATKEVVTLEYQRKVAKELQEYFKQKKLEEADQGPFFGFLGKNEITNGRWAMFGFAVGLLTEYATGSDFVQQIKILVSNFGIVDLE